MLNTAQLELLSTRVDRLLFGCHHWSIYDLGKRNRQHLKGL